MELLSGPRTLQDAVRSRSIVLVQFGAESCAPCKALQAKIKTWNQTCPEVCHLYVDAAEFPEVCAQLGVFTVPTIFVYVEGKLTLQQSGYFSLDHMLRKIETYRRLLEE